MGGDVVVEVVCFFTPIRDSFPVEKRNEAFEDRTGYDKIG